MFYTKKVAALALCAMLLLAFPCLIVALAATPIQKTESTECMPVATATDLVVTQTDIAFVNDDKPQSPVEKTVSITTTMIQAVCDELDLLHGKYWSVQEKGAGDCSSYMGFVTDRLTGSDYPVNGSDYKSYNYQNQYECHGFACYVMAKTVSKLRGIPIEAVPRTGDHSGWVKLLPHQVTDLKVGDIVRVESSSYEHTALVYAIDADGRAQFLESGGGNACCIRLGYGFNHQSEYDTLERITARYQLEYVYRYTGE